MVSANVDRRLESRKSHLVVSHGRNRRQNVLLTLVHHHTSLTWLCDEELSLHIQVTTALVQSLLDLCLIVQDMMHLVIYHIVAELLSLRALIFLGKSSPAKDTTSLTTFVQIGAHGGLTRRQD